MLALLEELLNSGPMWLFAPLGALLLLPAVIEAKPLIDAARLRSAAIAAGALALLAWAASAAAPAYSADRQQRFVIEDVTDAERGTGTWSVLNGGVPVPAAYRRDAQWRWGKLPYADSKRWLAGAPVNPAVKTPSAVLVATLRNGDERRISVRLHSNGADRITLVGPEDARIRAAGTGGFVRPIDAAAEDGRYLLSCSGRSCDGITLDIVTTAPKPIEFLIVGSRFGLPPSAAPLIAGRPRFARPQYVPDETVVFGRVKL
jgi:hypothetical protein